MSGLICLQGGHEFTADCREMDSDVLALIRPGNVVVLAGAARPGSDYAGASDRAKRHYAGLGASVVIVPDPRDDAEGALAGLTDDSSLLVLPGGSPASLRDVLRGEIEQRVRALHDDGMAISGASAGAMVLCEQMVRPGGSVDIVAGLGLVDGLALPHWSPGTDRGWPVPDGLHLWGLPECGGAVIDNDGTVRAVGRGDAAVRRDGVWEPLDRESRG